MIKVWVISNGCPFKILLIIMRHGVPVGAVGWVGASATVHCGDSSLELVLSSTFMLISGTQVTRSEQQVLYQLSPVFVL